MESRRKSNAVDINKRGGEERNKKRKSPNRGLGEKLAKSLLESISLIQILGALLMGWGIYVALIVSNILPFQYVILNKPVPFNVIIGSAIFFIVGYYLFKS